jgi:hypothetical protein
MQRISVDFPEPDAADDDALALGDSQIDIAKNVKLTEPLVDLRENDRRRPRLIPTAARGHKSSIRCLRHNASTLGRAHQSTKPVPDRRAGLQFLQLRMPNGGC